MTLLNKIVKIGTHSGCFHCDEVLACYMLKKLPEYKEAVIVRSRDPQELNPCDIVVDVGGIYDPSTHRYDHHQKTFQDSMSSLRSNYSSNIRLSSAGLVYHHFGERVLEAIAKKPLEPTILEKLFKFVYFHFVQEVDAIDNGIPMYETGEPLYRIHSDLSSRVGRLYNEDALPACFEKAMALAGSEFEECIDVFFNKWWPARKIVEDAINNRFNVHESGEIVELPICPWQSHLFDIEEEDDMKNVLKFVIFQDNNWRVRAVPVGPGNFVLRVPLEWKGERDESLQKASGIPDAVFVHATGFIGGAASREGAIAMALKTLELNKTTR